MLVLNKNSDGLDLGHLMLAETYSAMVSQAPGP
jgi:hypothetical protein